MKTIRQIADEIGVSKTAVNKQIANLGLRSGLRKNGNQFAIDEHQEALIKQSFSEKSQTEIENQTQTKSQTENHEVSDLVCVLQATIDTLQGQLEVKDRQIEKLTEALVTAQQTAAAAQALHAGMIQQQLHSSFIDEELPNQELKRQEKKTELKGEIKSLSGTVAALKAAERVRVDFDTIQPEKTLTGAVKGVTVDQIRQLKDVAMTGAAAKQTVVDLKKKNAVLEEEKAELKKKIPSVHEKMEAAAQRSRLESQNRQLWSENEELKEALEEERSFSDRLLEGIDRVLDMLESHLPKQLLHLVDKARDLLPEHQTYRQEKQHERGHSWGDMSL